MKNSNTELTINNYIIKELRNFLYEYKINEDKSIFYEAAIYSLKQCGIFFDDRRELTTVFRLIENIEEYHYLKDLLFFNKNRLYTCSPLKDLVSFEEAIDFIENCDDILYENLSNDFSLLIDEETIGFQTIFLINILNEYEPYNINLNKLLFLIWDLIRNDFFD